MGATYTDITDPAVGGSFVTGGYNVDHLRRRAKPALQAGMAWGGTSGGYITTTVNLGANVNGRRSSCASAWAPIEAAAAPGWHIDNVAITGASCAGGAAEAKWDQRKSDAVRCRNWGTSAPVPTSALTTMW